MVGNDPNESVARLADVRVLDCSIFHHPRCVANRCTRLHRAKRRYLSHSLRSIPLQAVLNNLAAPIIGKLHVDVRHLPTFDIQEPLKEQTVGQRVEVCDLQAVENQTGRSGTSNRRKYPLLFDEPEDVPND